MARKKKKGISTDIEDLNLVPIMNLVVCLIPMVLLGMSLVKVGVVNVNAPKFGQGAATPEDSDKKPLNLTVAVGADGFRLQATADLNAALGTVPAAPAPDAAAADPTAAPPVLIPKKGEEYDYVELYNKMKILKDKFPDESIVNLTAEAKIPFKHLIFVMDSLRVQLAADSYNDLDAFKNADLKYENNQPVLLWPDVVFAVAQ
jgi:biopolymer transport protein ExbD